MHDMPLTIRSSFPRWIFLPSNWPALSSSQHGHSQDVVLTTVTGVTYQGRLQKIAIPPAWEYVGKEVPVPLLHIWDGQMEHAIPFTEIRQIQVTPLAQAGAEGAQPAAVDLTKVHFVAFDVQAGRALQQEVPGAHVTYVAFTPKLAQWLLTDQMVRAEDVVGVTGRTNFSPQDYSVLGVQQSIAVNDPRESRWWGFVLAEIRRRSEDQTVITLFNREHLQTELGELLPPGTVAKVLAAYDSLAGMEEETLKTQL